MGLIGIFVQLFPSLVVFHKPVPVLWDSSPVPANIIFLLPGLVTNVLDAWLVVPFIIPTGIDKKPLVNCQRPPLAAATLTVAPFCGGSISSILPLYFVPV